MKKKPQQKTLTIGERTGPRMVSQALQGTDQKGQPRKAAPIFDEAAMKARAQKVGPGTPIYLFFRNCETKTWEVQLQGGLPAGTRGKWWEATVIGQVSTYVCVSMISLFPFDFVCIVCLCMNQVGTHTKAIEKHTGFSGEVQRKKWMQKIWLVDYMSGNEEGITAYTARLKPTDIGATRMGG